MGSLVLAYESCSVEAEVGASLRDPQCTARGGPPAQLPQCELTGVCQTDSVLTLDK